MPKYKVELKPQGAIPRGSRTDVRLTPIGEAPEAEETCCNECGGWAVTIDGDPSTGNLHGIPNQAPDPVVMTVEHLGELCPGACIEWELRALLDPQSTASEWTVTPNGCNAVTIDIEHTTTEAYDGILFALVATIDGNPFCETLIITNEIPSCEPDLSGVTLVEALNPGVPPFGSGTVPFTGSYPIGVGTPFDLYVGVDEIISGSMPEWICECIFDATVIDITGGDPGAYGELTVTALPLFGGAPGFHLAGTGTGDYTGIQITVRLTLIDCPNPVYNGTVWGSDVILLGVP